MSQENLPGPDAPSSSGTGNTGTTTLYVDPNGSPNLLGPKLTPPQMGVRPEHTKPLWYVAMIFLASSACSSRCWAPSWFRCS